MSGIAPAPVVTQIIPIIPSQVTADGTSFVPGWLLATTMFVLGSVLMILMIGFIFMMVFGQPMSVAKKTVTSGGSIIQHFNTSKSAAIKDATVSGGAFRYKNIRDGTVAAATNSVNNIKGRQLVLTYAQLGVTIPIPVLGGISQLVHNNINNINDLKRKLTFTEVYKEKGVDPITGEEIEVEVGRVEKMKNDVIITGYNFEDFQTLLKQSEEEKLIPLVVESVPDFVERNISADYTEKKIKIRQMLYQKDEPTNDGMKIMAIAVAVAIIFIIGMFFR